MARIDNRERMRRLIGQWGASGQTMAEFVRTHGLTRSKFEYWRRRLGGQRPSRRSSRREVMSFIPVEVRDSEIGGPPQIEIVLANGDRLRVRADVPAEVLGQVVRVLREGC